MLSEILSGGVFLFLLSYLLTPKFTKLLKRVGLVGIDVHKLEKPRIPESGGVILIIFVSVFTAAVYFLLGSDLVLWVLTISTLFGLFGFLDDLYTLGKHRKFTISFIVTLFGMYLFFTEHIFNMATLLVGMFVLLIGSNIFNWFAGLNGLEIGVSAIITGFMALNLYLLDKVVPFYLTVGLFFALLSFLIYNKYPASIFPGDSGTLFVGGFLTALTLYFNLWNLFVPLLSLHILNAFLKLFSAGYFSFTEKKPTQIEEDGKLRARNDFISLPRLILRFKRTSEPSLVITIWILTIIIGIVTTFAIQGGVL